MIVVVDSSHFGTDFLANVVRLLLVVNMVGPFLKIKVFRKTTELAHFLTHVKVLVMDLYYIVLSDLDVVRIILLFDGEIRFLAS